MTPLAERFEQAVSAAARTRPPDTQAVAACARLDALYRQATAGPPDVREDAMRAYIELVGGLGQQDG